MDLSRIDLNLLSAFDALFTERHVTRAARRLGIGQPAMSDALRRLRLLFGDDLFVRASDGMQPTPRAKTIGKEIAPLLAGLRQVMGEQAAFVPQAAAQTFTIASTDYTTLVLLPDLIPALRREAPCVDLRIVGYEKDAVGAMLDRGEVDLAVGVFRDPPPNSVRSRLFDERFVGLVRRDHPALASGSIDLQTFADLPHALVSVRRDDRGVIDHLLQKRGLRRRIALVVPYMLLLPDVLAASDLIAVVPERAARRVGGTGIVRFDIPLETEVWAVDVLWNPVARTDQATQWLRRLLTETAKLS